MKFETTRAIPATPAAVFAAFADARRLARWWGPAGFTNTFELCDFRPGGDWVFVMHGPDGANYPNRSRFADIEPDRRIVIDHVCEPLFRLTVTLTPLSDWATRVDWEQVFESADLARQIEHIVTPANEQNLDRLTVEVTQEPS